MADWTGVRERVLVLRGSELEDPLSVQEVNDLEAQLNTSLPEEYRSFLVEVGAGGAGPAYGVFPVRQPEGGTWSWIGGGAEIADLALIRDPIPGRLDEAVVTALFEDRPDEEDLENPDDFWPLYEAWERRMGDVMWSPERTAGAICVCDHGCALRSWLIVSGPERGRIWYDGRADEEDMTPLLIDGQPATFERWYLSWLNEAEKKILKSD